MGVSLARVLLPLTFVLIWNSIMVSSAPMSAENDSKPSEVTVILLSTCKSAPTVIASDKRICTPMNRSTPITGLVTLPSDISLTFYSGSECSGNKKTVRSIGFDEDKPDFIPKSFKIARN